MIDCSTPYTCSIHNKFESSEASKAWCFLALKELAWRNLPLVLATARLLPPLLLLQIKRIDGAFLFPLRKQNFFRLASKFLPHMIGIDEALFLSFPSEDQWQISPYLPFPLRF
jgi:hypothetical protein